MTDVTAKPFDITLDQLIEALVSIRDDERNFTLDYSVSVSNKGIFILSGGFLHQKIHWFLEVED